MRRHYLLGGESFLVLSCAMRLRTDASIWYRSQADTPLSAAQRLQWTTLEAPFVYTFAHVGRYVALDKSEDAEARRLVITVTCPEGFAETADHDCRRV